MSEDTDAKAGNRRRRTTRAGRRRAGRAPDAHADAGSEQWSPAWSSDPETLPGDIVEEIGEEAEAESESERGEDAAAESAGGDAADDADGEREWAASDDLAEDADDDDRKPTAEIMITPFTLAQLQDDEKTNPRIRVGDMGSEPPPDAETERGTERVVIWSRPSRVRPEAEPSIVAIQPAVVITPARVISDRPPPMHVAKSRVRSTPQVEAAAAATSAEVAKPASTTTAPAQPEMPATPPAIEPETSFEPFDESIPPPAPATAAATAAPGTAATAPATPPTNAAPPATPPTSAAAPATPPTNAAPTAAASAAAPLADAAGTAAVADEAEAEQGLQIVDMDVAELEQARRSRTPPPPPPDARGKPAPAKRPPPPPAPAKAAEDDRQKRKQVRQWWERFFSDDYLMSVRPATQAQIAKQVDFVEQSLAVSKGGTILDVGCGLGLHAVELTRRGYLVVGLDLSLAMITRAAELAQQQQLKLNVVHADIREMEFDGAFDGVICMGTTFGFFDDDANRDVLARLHHALRPGGRVLLDMVNRDYVIRLQPNLVWFEGDECVCMEESDFNYFNSRLTVKRTMMREDGKQSNAEYSVRLYSLHELGLLMQQVGFRVIEVSGQEAIRGAFFGANSPRMLMLAERRALPRSTNIPPERGSAEQSKPSTNLPPERPSADAGRPSTNIPPERSSAEIPKVPKPD